MKLFLFLVSALTALARESQLRSIINEIMEERVEDWFVKPAPQEKKSWCETNKYGSEAEVGFILSKEDPNKFGTLEWGRKCKNSPNTSGENGLKGCASAVYAEPSEAEVGVGLVGSKQEEAWRPQIVTVSVKFGKKGGNYCSKYFTATECEELTKTSTTKWGHVASWRYKPKGCIWERKKDILYFNTHARGRGQSNPETRTVCKIEKYSSECMVKVCDNCEWNGGETKKSDGSIESCKRRCLEDPGCLGIDVGKSNNKCYFAHASAVRNDAFHPTIENSSYQAWKKSTNCDQPSKQYCDGHADKFGENNHEQMWYRNYCRWNGKACVEK